MSIEKSIELKSNFILVKPLEMPKVMGSIVIPDTVKAPRRGIDGQILKIGDEVNEPRLRVGTKVLFNQYGGTKIDYNGETFYLLKISDLFGTWERKEKPFSKSLSEMTL